jgi:hypothetical protein
MRAAPPAVHVNAAGRDRLLRLEAGFDLIRLNHGKV